MITTRLLAILTLVCFTVGCATDPTTGKKVFTPQGAALATNAVTLANIAATAAATYYGGPAAGQLASDGLYALGSVAQGYIGSTMPNSVILATPGVQGVGTAIAAQLPPGKTISQSTVDSINRAAAIAATLKSVDLKPIPPANP